MDPFSGRIASMIERTAQIKKRSPIRVDVVSETAILRGRVATQQDRELAENLVRLEPGIWDVKNLLIADDSARVTTISIRSAGE
jgi:osmotically-inducible protein OsmY